MLIHWLWGISFVKHCVLVQHGFVIGLFTLYRFLGSVFIDDEVIIHMLALLPSEKFLMFSAHAFPLVV